MNPYAARAKIVQFFDRLNTSRSGECGIQLPAIVAASTSAAPISDASTTLPLRILYMYRATKSAIGIVQAMLNMPHDEPGTRSWLLGGSFTIAARSFSNGFSFNSYSSDVPAGI